MNATEKKLGIDIVGLGIGEQHALAYARHDACQLRWLFDLSRDQADAVRHRLGEGRLAGDLSVILEDRETAVVSLASYDHHHFDQVMACFGAGKNIFVEKPLCRTLDELRRLAAAWRAAGRPYLASNLVLRAAPIYGWLKDAIAAGRLGHIYAIDGDYLYGRLHKITDGWRRDVPAYSVMEGGGIHLIDLMMWLSGERPEHAFSVGNGICTQDTPFQHHDFMAATYRFRSGLIGRITANFGCVHRHHHGLRVFGTEATFILDDAGARLHTSRDDATGAEAIDAATLPDGKGVLIPAFVDAILSQADSGPMAAREFDLIAATAAADQALAAGHEIEIEYVT